MYFDSVLSLANRFNTRPTMIFTTGVNWRLYSLPVFTGGGGADMQEGDGIARTWIVIDSKIYPVYRFPKDVDGCLKGQ